MHEYYVIKQRLTDQLLAEGLQPQGDDIEPDVCGSIYSIFASDSARLLVGWDGEEGFGYVETWMGNNQWRMLSSKVPEGTAEQFAADLEELATEVARHLQSKHHS